ncbi:hypothetical protein [Halarcobacter sp.]|uniref:hypothetical protein n=1 Tax=Halarcobacter sp. TaxID=2321133 RepID=UPI002AAA9BFD|nr:hypothetical protein [Halarcobacter sp.]
MSKNKYKLLHIVPVGIKGAKSIISKYLNYREVFEQTLVDYILVIVVPKGFFDSFLTDLKNNKNIYIIETKYINKKCIFKRSMINAKKDLDLLIKNLKPSKIILRVGMLDKVYINFIRQHRPIVEQASAPIEHNFIKAPIYDLLAKKYIKELLELTPLMIGCLDYFKIHYKDYKDKIFILHNSLQKTKYISKRYRKKFRKEYNLLLMSNIYSPYSYCGYDRLLLGINNYIKENKKIKPINLYVLGDDIKGFKSILHKNKLVFNPKFVRIKYLGYKTIKECNKIIDKIDLGINDLAVHRKSLKTACTLKTLDFVGWNLPFVLSYEDENLKSIKPGVFYYKYEASDKAIDFNELIDFVEKMKKREYLKIQKHKKKIALNKRLNQLIQRLNILDGDEI